MASGQDPLDKDLLDNWTIHEKLCLASVVSTLGDNNWVDISQNMKTLCEKDSDGLRRPDDWYSEKSCALQYEHLLKNIEDSKNMEPAVVTTPLKYLKEKRMDELQEQIRKDQQEYARIQEALEKLKSPDRTLEMLQEMWREVEKEEETKRRNEMEWENELHEREQRKHEMQEIRPTGASTSTTVATEIITTPTIKQESSVIEMDVEEIIGVSKPMQTSTSPLLSSLLKSPTSTAPQSSLNITSSARTTAPTITTLLTSGTIPKSNQPAITLNTDLIPPEKAVQLLSRPISGPPSGDFLKVSNTTALTLLSPSKSAPTLSMLLEKNKTTPTTSAVNNQQVNVSTVHTKSNSKSESLNEEKLKQDKEKAIAQQIKTEHDSDGPDANEEQQLMEVFKNIGNIELDLDVAAVINDEEVDFLKTVDQESPPSTVEKAELENKTDQKSEIIPDIESKIEEKETESKGKDSTKSTVLKNENILEKKLIKIETSSDDSNDNIPLAALENKERSSLTPTENEAKVSESCSKSIIEPTDLNSKNKSTIVTVIKEEVIEKLETMETTEDIQENFEVPEKSDATEIKCQEEISSSELKLKEDPVDAEKVIKENETANKKELETSEKQSIVDEDNKPDIHHAESDNAVENFTSDAPSRTEELIVASDIKSELTQVEENVNVSETTLPPPPQSYTSVADTDEDSCTTDISSITTTTKREEKPTTPETRHKSERAASQTRRLGIHDASSKSTEDSDSSSSHRATKRSLVSILNNLSSSKSAQTIQQALNDEEINMKYERSCYRRLDFQTIKKSIENGSIRSFIDLQRDLLHFMQNINFMFYSKSPIYKASEVFKHEMQSVREFVFNANEFEEKSEKEVKEIKQAATKQSRTGSRKSLRIS